MPFNIKVTHEIEQQIKADIRKGGSNPEIAKKYGLSDSTISRIRHENNHKIRGAGRLVDGRKKAPLIPLSKVDTHLCKTCKWWQRLGSSSVGNFCAYMYHTGERRNSYPGDCNKWEKRPLGYIAPSNHTIILERWDG